MTYKTQIVADLKYILFLLESSDDLNIIEEEYKKLNAKSLNIKKFIDKKLKTKNK
jgi:hypothetical protein